MKWLFTPQRRGDVEMAVTQRDQFDNDFMKLEETIIREPIQNSLDASAKDWAERSGFPMPDGCSEVVKVVFRWVELKDTNFVNKLLKDQLPHAKAAGLGVDKIDFDNPTALIIEDFGTTGLLGDIKDQDKCVEKDFHGFWRAHGNSNKEGASRGRWGLGKLVYSCTSELGVFFGLTLRPDDKEQYLMGQTVLNSRSYDGKKYPPHAYFCNLEDEDNDPLPIPCDDKSFMETFCNIFSLDRDEQPGLSIAIPFPNPSFNAEAMIGTSIANYFYPLITGKLELQFNNIEINATNVRCLAKKYAEHLIQDIDNLFDFIEASHEIIKSRQYIKIDPKWIEDKKLDKDDFDENQLEHIKTRFRAGDLIALWLPVTLVKKTGSKVTSGFSVFLQKPDGIQVGRDLYVRGGLTLPGEEKFSHQLAFGAMIAEEETISELLGYAENAAHTGWVARAEKLKAHYIKAGAIITPIRHCITQLFNLISETEGDRDQKALIDYFKAKEPIDKKEQNTKKKKTKAEVVVIPSKPEEFSTVLISTGFKVASEKGFKESSLPRELIVEVAYDNGKKSRFKKYSPHDFQLGEGTIKIDQSGLKEISRSPNKLTYDILSLPFKLAVIGFDENRDLKIKSFLGDIC